RGGPAGGTPGRVGGGGRLRGVHSGQVVGAELAAIGLLAGAGGGVPWLMVTAPPAAIILLMAFGRIHRHWGYEWLGLGSRYFGRRRSMPRGGDAEALLALPRPAPVVRRRDLDTAAPRLLQGPARPTALIPL